MKGLLDVAKRLERLLIEIVSSNKVLLGVPCNLSRNKDHLAWSSRHDLREAVLQAWEEVRGVEVLLRHARRGYFLLNLMPLADARQRDRPTCFHMGSRRGLSDE